MAWQTPDAKEVAELVRDINRIEPALRFNPDVTLLEKLDLPFYPKGFLLKAQKAERFGDPLWYVKIPAETVVLDGSLSNVHHLNDIAPLVLTGELIYPYLKFRYYFGAKTQILEAQVKRSSVGYTGRVWGFQSGVFFESDINVNTRGIVIELDKTPAPEVPNFTPAEFSL